jgi:hypothetical protein
MYDQLDAASDLLIINQSIHTKHIVPRCRPPDRQPTTTTGHHTTCCNLQSHAPDDGHNFVRNMFELMLKINKCCYLLHLVGFDFY